MQAPTPCVATNNQRHDKEMRETLYILTHCPAISDESLGGDFLGESSDERTQEEYATAEQTASPPDHNTTSSRQSTAEASTARESQGSEGATPAPYVSISLGDKQVYKAPLDGGLYIPSVVLEQAVDRLTAFAGYSHPRGVADTMVRAESIYLAVQRGSGRTQVRILSPLAKKDHTTHQRESHR